MLLVVWLIGMFWFYLFCSRLTLKPLGVRGASYCEGHTLCVQLRFE